MFIQLQSESCDEALKYLLSGFGAALVDAALLD